MKNFLRLAFLIAFLPNLTFAQTKEPTQVQVDFDELLRLSKEFDRQFKEDSTRAARLALEGKAVIFEIQDDRSVIGLVRFDENGHPVFYGTDNLNAAKTVATNIVWSGGGFGYALDGSGITIGEWDGGGVRTTHNELTGRVSQIDSPSALSDHSTHVAGTMIATGLSANAHGMANQADIDAYDFFNDDSEMSSFASNGGLLSNHSYGRITGWRFMSSSNSWRWYGDTTISGVEDWAFGFYTWAARSWDLIANAAPYYLIVKSAGNDRNDAPPANLASHEVWDNILGTWVNSTAQRPKDGGATGYDCTSSSSNAKNILTVGAVGDIPNGYTQPSDVQMSTFSGWGPTDDGRIKPDLVANGITLYSTGSLNDSDYYSSSGTSMSAPNVTGSLALLQQFYFDTTGSYMRSATLKALVIHTADEAGSNPGPDYSFGWGLLNTKKAADVIADTNSWVIQEDSIANGDTNSYTVWSPGTMPLKVTIAWNDPAATPPTPQLDPVTPMLINDLDIRIYDSTGTAYQPWVLNPASPASAATTGDNARDNVEQILIATPFQGTYTIEVTHKGTLSPGQAYSLIITGASNQVLSGAPIAGFTYTPSGLCQGNSVQFTDVSTNNPSSWLWTFPGGTPATSTAQNPSVTYNTAGQYDVTLVVSNANGTDSLTITNAINVIAAPVVSTQPFSNVCANDPAFALTGGSPSGGTWAGPGVTGSTTFNPSMAGPGTHLLTYSVSNLYCTTTDTQSITVDSVPVVSHPNLPGVCTGSTAFPLIGGTPPGGTYSGTGVIGGTFFDPSSAGIGTHSLTYMFQDSNGCQASAAFTVTVIPGGSVSLPPLSDVCEGDTAFQLTGGTPAGGIYYGSGVDTATGYFHPSVAGAGTHIITYVNAGGLCAAADTSSITVNTAPVVSLAPFADACINDAPFALTGGTPSGGSYSGPGVSGGMFSPAIAGTGSHTIVYSYTDPNGCMNSDSTTLTVVNAPVISISSLSGICTNDTAFVLTIASPAGGTYSGPGIAGNIFNPSAAGAGTHTVYYTITIGGCSATDSATISVNFPPAVTLQPFNDVCLQGGPLTLTGGMPAGGTYSGPGITGGVFDPVAAGLGTHTITYTYSDPNGCSDSASATITVVNSIAITITDLTGICTNDSAFLLTIAMPAGGTYSGTGVTGNMFDPAVAGAGVHTVYYTYSQGGCTSMDSATITVDQAPVVGLQPFADVCLSGGTVVLTGGTPTGGTYSGPGVSGGVFNPAITGIGTFTITYTFTNPSGCSDAATATITVVDNLTEIVNISDSYCVNGGSDSLIGIPAGGTFSGPGMTGNVFDPAAAGVGTHTITYTVTTGSCPGSASYVITVNPKPQIGQIQGATTANQTLVYGYSVPVQNGAQYTWLVSGGTIVSNNNNQITVQWGTGSSGTVTAILTNQIGCSDTTSLTVELWVLGIDVPGNNVRINIYPNPLDDLLTLSGKTESGKTVTLRLFTVTGQQVLEKRQDISGDFEMRTNVSGIARGVYFVNVYVDDSLVHSGKLIKN